MFFFSAPETCKPVHWPMSPPSEECHLEPGIPGCVLEIPEEFQESLCIICHSRDSYLNLFGVSDSSFWRYLDLKDTKLKCHLPTSNTRSWDPRLKFGMTKFWTAEKTPSLSLQSIQPLEGFSQAQEAPVLNEGCRIINNKKEDPKCWRAMLKCCLAMNLQDDLGRLPTPLNSPYLK